MFSFLLTRMHENNTILSLFKNLECRTSFKKATNSELDATSENILFFYKIEH
ncbi:hypothetical protein LEP1GSC151_0759 [Leptospira interrogans serovar Grippotyphosa str. LT2186]|uniref:Uncharacterized protein n=3 Tax=Leptospira interrogans TaxID=173 RepID=M3I1Q6_LEPIR|nr:hypothetical protein LEP1GSC097_2457 [Leptospira interrogans serovar Grippotyphosa str. UI 08368]EMG09847.1 hypothetical protein LEP1GSC151_0759 [Leptospira interrogans serovar Grippotyphosa str. LT2186]EMM79508.1 hypothetical protein LEP1GSC037_5309 [Leptospira interrogans str. 2006001854]EMN81065.1 hypothetical protein LEP1GSC106_5011 [Leptospira interrogans serovar Grippotyphosa str. UI 12764]EMN86570.1 hypothetical protein LEP1GSC107_3777 [Leptospira interrogans serovar Grippotyphosa str